MLEFIWNELALLHGYFRSKSWLLSYVSSKPMYHTYSPNGTGSCDLYKDYMKLRRRWIRYGCRSLIQIQISLTDGITRLKRVTTTGPWNAIKRYRHIHVQYSPNWNWYIMLTYYVISAQGKESKYFNWELFYNLWPSWA